MIRPNSREMICLGDNIANGTVICLNGMTVHGAGMQRKLAAILSTDVVGYSRLMEADEADTFARLKSTRENLVDPKIAAHNGRIVKLMGDGALVEFASVVDAVACAVEIQRTMAEGNAELPKEKQLEFR